MTRANRRGFTLVELLVVVTLVAILVAVLVPVTVQSRNRARSIACLSNLRQLGGAIMAYGQDWQDRLPTLSATPFAGSAACDEWPEGSSATQLREAISRYVKNSGVYRCPNDLGSPEYGYAERSVSSRAGSSYLPWSSARSGRYGVAINGARTSGLSRSSGHVLVRDYGGDWHGYRTRSGLDVEVLTVANAAYADGHSAALPVFTVAAGDRSYCCWTSGESGTSGSVFVSGGSGDVRAELSGRLSAGPAETRLSLSGTVSGSEPTQNVDRVFVFGSSTTLDSAFRQVVVWADGLAAR